MNKDNEITIGSSTKNLILVREFLDKCLLDSSVEQETASQIILAVDEACTNIIKHTHKNNNSEKISIIALKRGKEFRIEIIYSGKPFNPSEVSVPDMNEYFKKYKVGGLGVPLIKKIINKIEFSHNKSNVNNLILIKYLN